MTVRNFWIEASIDGRETKLAGGPRSKDGGFFLRVFIRDEGSILQAVKLYGRASADGKLYLWIEPDTQAGWQEEGNQLYLITRREGA